MGFDAISIFVLFIRTKLLNMPALKTILSSFANDCNSLLHKVSGTSFVATQNKQSEIISMQQHSLKCTCGWKGKESEGIRKYHQLTNDAVELEVYCAKCKKYIGFKLFKDVA